MGTAVYTVYSRYTAYSRDSQLDWLQFKQEGKDGVITLDWEESLNDH